MRRRRPEPVVGEVPAELVEFHVGELWRTPAAFHRAMDEFLAARAVWAAQHPSVVLPPHTVDGPVPFDRSRFQKSTGTKGRHVT